MQKPSLTPLLVGGSLLILAACSSEKEKETDTATTNNEQAEVQNLAGQNQAAAGKTPATSKAMPGTFKGKWISGNRMRPETMEITDNRITMSLDNLELMALDVAVTTENNDGITAKLSSGEQTPFPEAQFSTFENGILIRGTGVFDGQWIADTEANKERKPLP